MSNKNDKNINKIQNIMYSGSYEDLCKFNDKEMEEIIKELQLYDDEMNMRVKFLEQKFKKGKYSHNLREMLKALNKFDLVYILKEMGFKAKYKNKKEELLNLIENNYEEKVYEKISLFDDDALAFLKKFSANDGEISLVNIYDEDEDNTFIVNYLMDLGMLFPSYNEKAVLLLPTKMEEIIKNLNTFEYRYKVRNNTRVTKICAGMMNAYGVMKINTAINMIKKYLGHDFENEDILYILKESGRYRGSYKIIDNFIINMEIDNWKVLYRDISLRSKYNTYKDFTEEELILLGEKDWIRKNKYGKEFIDDFLENFEVEDGDIDEIMFYLYELIQDRSVDKVLKEFKGMMGEKEGVDIGLKIIKRYISNLPKWINKGRSINEAMGIIDEEYKNVCRNNSVICNKLKNNKKSTRENGKVIKLQ